MGVTSFGVIWIILILIYILKDRDNIYIFLVVAAVFQASAVMYIGSNYVTPFLFTEIIFLLLFLQKPKVNKEFSNKKAFNILLLFTIFTVVISFIAPFIFSGIYVRPNKIGADYLYLVGSGIPLSFSSSNLNQIVLLVVNVICFYIILRTKSEKKDIKLIKGLFLAIVLVLSLGVWDLLAKKTGLYFPRSVIFSNLAYGEVDENSTVLGGITRFIGTFTEASYCGAFLAASFWFVFLKSLQNSKYIVLAIFIFIILVLNLSGTGFATFFVGSILFIILQNKIKYWFVLIFGVIIFFVSIKLMGYDELILEMLLTKTESLSGETRLDLNMFSWKIFIDTYGVGVGLGSNRAASFFFLLLSNVGLIGTLLFTSFLYRLVKVNLKIKEETLHRLFFFFLTFFAQLIAIPDISVPLFWVSLFLIIPPEIIEKSSYNMKK